MVLADEINRTPPKTVAIRFEAMQERFVTVGYASSLVRATRLKEKEAPDFVKELVGWGAGPRAGIALITAAKARTILQGRYHATSGDVQHAAYPVPRYSKHQAQRALTGISDIRPGRRAPHR